MSENTEPVCISCKHPISTLVHIISCADDRICFDCDHKWIAADANETEQCPRENCDGIGEPI